jgi:hypothetical protein
MTTTRKLLFAGDPLPVPIDATRNVVELPPRVFRARLKGLLFDTMRTFLLPGALASIKRLKFYYEEHPGAEVLVVGHADRAGDAAYNVKLSRERAESIAAYLRDDVEVWLEWYHYVNTPVEITPRRWDAREDKHMLSHLVDGSGQPFFSGPIDASATSAYRDAIKRFKTARNAEGAGFKLDSEVDDAFRRELIRVYMAEDDTTLPAGTVLLVHGCGESHAEPGFETKDGVANDENRRVEVFLFEDRIDPLPQDACPPPKGCAEHAQWLGTTVHTIDMRLEMPVVSAARFELGGGEPAASRKVAIRLLDARRQPCPKVEATLFAGENRRIARADDQGVVRAELPGDPDAVVVRYVPPGASSLVTCRVRLDLGPVSDDAAAKDRLRNLGYPVDEGERLAIQLFQHDQRLSESGVLDAATRARLAELHDV